MNILKVKSVDAVNGPGVRASIWVAGCTNNCKGCWAPDTWNPNQGIPYRKIKGGIIKSISNPYLDGVSILGGDPFYWGVKEDEELLDLLETITSILLPKQDVWAWTGYTVEQLRKNEFCNKCLQYIDVLVDSPFILEQRDLTLRFRGSNNQRIIDVKTSEDITRW